MRGPVACSATL